MKIILPNIDAFELPDEWLRDSAMSSFVPNSRYYPVNLSACTCVVPIGQIEPPMRDNGERWFRNRDSVIALLKRMRDGGEIDPIEVWSKEKKTSTSYIVRDGFHRFYLSVALGYSEIPIKINDFDMYKFFEQEQRGASHP